MDSIEAFSRGGKGGWGGMDGYSVRDGGSVDFGIKCGT